MQWIDADTINKLLDYPSLFCTALASGDLHLPLKSGAINPEDILGDLFDLCRNQPEPSQPDQITVFRNAGGAHLDLYAAQLLAQRIRPR